MPAFLDSQKPNKFIVARAWFVHFYTSLGLICALVAVLAIANKDIVTAFFALVVAQIIDGSDGPMARAFDVKTNTPHFDGRKLDDIIDYMTYTFIPVFFMYTYEIVTGPWLVVLFMVLLASAYGFCSDAAKTDDGFFTGFPSYWNGAALYLFWLNLPTWGAGLFLLFFVILTFIPVKYPSANQTRQFRWLTYLVAAVWVVLVIWMIAIDWQNPPRWMLMASFFFPVYYLGMGFYLTYKNPG